MNNFTFFLFLVASTLCATTLAFSVRSRGLDKVAVAPAVSIATSQPLSAVSMTRRTSFAAVLAGALLLAPSISFAKPVESPAKKPAEKECDCEGEQNKESCLDLCLYECVKHGGSQDDCVVDCVRQCKTEKGQRTMATPITEKGVDYK